ncbi:MAG: DUF4124 domain-containing protein [Gammaproteobacteria bacterium]|nr:MAG: DUF4124 domain-containing protein [Gammaproteobacteria bacterium]
MIRSLAPVALALACLVPPMLAQGAVYKWVGPDGKVTYSDRPQPGAQEMKLPKEPPPPPEVKAIPATAPSASPPLVAKPGEKPAAEFKGYSKVAIVKPKNDEAVRSNNGNLDVELALEPAFDSTLGHQFMVSVDGKPFGEAQTQPSFQLLNLDRGTHSLRVEVKDAQGKTVGDTGSIVFHILRVSVQ